jgi:hypothetical protein
VSSSSSCSTNLLREWNSKQFKTIRNNSKQFETHLVAVVRGRRLVGARAAHHHVRQLAHRLGLRQRLRGAEEGSLVCVHTPTERLSSRLSPFKALRHSHTAADAVHALAVSPERAYKQVRGTCPVLSDTHAAAESLQSTGVEPPPRLKKTLTLGQWFHLCFLALGCVMSSAWISTRTRCSTPTIAPPPPPRGDLCDRMLRIFYRVQVK